MLVGSSNVQDERDTTQTKLDTVKFNFVELCRQSNLIFKMVKLSSSGIAIFLVATTWQGGHVGGQYNSIFSRKNYMKMEFSSQSERNAFVLDHQHGRRDVTCKPAVWQYIAASNKGNPLSRKHWGHSTIRHFRDEKELGRGNLRKDFWDRYWGRASQLLANFSRP